MTPEVSCLYMHTHYCAVYNNNMCVAVHSLKLMSTSEGNELSTTSPAPYYDYCSVPATGTGGGAETGAQPEERVYATIPNGDNNYYRIGVDYTTICEDPTSPSYVVGI